MTQKKVTAKESRRTRPRKTPRAPRPARAAAAVAIRRRRRRRISVRRRRLRRPRRKRSALRRRLKRKSRKSRRGKPIRRHRRRLKTRRLRLPRHAWGNYHSCWAPMTNHSPGNLWAGLQAPFRITSLLYVVFFFIGPALVAVHPRCRRQSCPSSRVPSSRWRRPLRSRS